MPSWLRVIWENWGLLEVCRGSESHIAEIPGAEEEKQLAICAGEFWLDAGKFAIAPK